jgi:error-prone DNA polymerase
MRQRPGRAKGIVFVTIEGGFGVANLVVYADIGARDRAAPTGSRLLVSEERIERETEHAEVPVTHLICRSIDCEPAHAFLFAFAAEISK